MSLLIIMPTLFLGGAETQFRMLFEKAVKKGISVFILSLKPSPSTKEYSTFKRKYGNHVKELRLRKCPFILKLLLFSFYLILFRMKGMRNVLVYETYWLLPLPLMRLLSYKVLYSERNTGEHKLSLMYYLIKKCNFVSTNSIEAEKILRKKTGRDDIMVINNGVVIPETDIRYVKKSEPSNCLFRIVVPARICRVKNQNLVIDALANVEFTEIHFAGKIAERDYYEEMVDKITRLNLKNRFLFDGYCDNWMELYKDFDLVLLPSLAEGTSNVILESFANMRLILVSNIEMNARLERDENFVFKVGDTSSLRDSVLRIKDMTQDSINRHLQVNYDFVMENFSASAMAMAYINELK